MARPKGRAGGFSLAEIAVLADQSKSAIHFLRGQDDGALLPSGDDPRVANRAAAIGGLCGTGVPLLLAARMARVLLFEFNDVSGEVPSNLSSLATRLPQEEIASLPEDPSDLDFHSALLRHPHLYTPGRPIVGDLLLEIVDRRHAFMQSLGIRRLDDPAYLGWVEGWERGGEARMHHVLEEFDWSDEQWKPSEREYERLRAEALIARENAVGRIIVNINLAIRVAFDRLAAWRAGEESPSSESAGG